jgi:hypothetical protein
MLPFAFSLYIAWVSGISVASTSWWFTQSNLTMCQNGHCGIRQWLTWIFLYKSPSLPRWLSPSPDLLMFTSPKFTAFTNLDLYCLYSFTALLTALTPPARDMNLCQPGVGTKKKNLSGEEPQRKEMPLWRFSSPSPPCSSGYWWALLPVNSLASWFW